MQHTSFPTLPNHLAVILDGNRRYAKKHGLHPWDGHKAGAEKLKEFLAWVDELGISELTLYAFSLQNFERSKQEVAMLMELFETQLRLLLTRELPTLQQKNVRVRFIGRLNLFSSSLSSLMQELMEKTAHHDGRTLTLALAYGGREEILDACNALLADVLQKKTLSLPITEEVFSSYLWLSSSPDLIIRTGGAVRTSNFLPWQSVYSEWIFLDKYWPEFTKEDLYECLAIYAARERRFGK